MKIYQNGLLQEFYNETVSAQWKNRDFVEYARRYFLGANKKILAIGGLRGTGKTTGLLQSANLTDTLYITAQKGESEIGADYIEIIKHTDKKTIIIDEYSWIKDRKELDYYLYTAVQNGKRIAITGTESITLDFLNYGNLIHRVDMVHVNLFTYEEYCRLYQKKQSQAVCDEYLTTGGVFKEYILSNYDTTKNYVKTAIIDNLVGYMDGTMSEEKATALVYAVLFKAVCPSNLKKIPVISQNKLAIENFLADFNVDSDTVFTEAELKRVADILEQVGVIVRVENYDQSNVNKCQYYIVNPSLTCQLILAAYKLPQITREILGHVYEATVLCHLSYHLADGHRLYFLNTEIEPGVNKELDAVVLSENKDYAYFFECKHRADAVLSEKSTILSDDLQSVFPNSSIEARYVVFNGTPALRKYGEKEVLFSSLDERVSQYYLYDYYREQLIKEHE